MSAIGDIECFTIRTDHYFGGHVFDSYPVIGERGDYLERFHGAVFGIKMTGKYLGRKLSVYIQPLVIWVKAIWRGQEAGRHFNA